MRKIVITGLAMILVGCGQSAEERAQRECNSKQSAHQISQKFVENRLRSPGSAEFPYVMDDGVRVEPRGDCMHEVWSYVDADNAFGGNVRTRYYAKVQFILDEKVWRLRDLRIN